MMIEDYVEYTAENMPYHLRLDAPALARCSKCLRYSWDETSIGRDCRMPQPNGSVCGGQFVLT